MQTFFRLIAVSFSKLKLHSDTAALLSSLFCTITKIAHVLLLYFVIFSSPSFALLIENVLIEAHFDRTFFVLLIIIIGFFLASFFFNFFFLSFKCTLYVEVEVVLQLVVVVVMYKTLICTQLQNQDHHFDDTHHKFIAGGSPHHHHQNIDYY